MGERKEKRRERKVSGKQSTPFYIKSFPLSLYSTISERIVYKLLCLCRLPFFLSYSSRDPTNHSNTFCLWHQYLHLSKSRGIVSVHAVFSCSAAFYTIVYTLLLQIVIFGFPCPHILVLFPFSMVTPFLLFYIYFFLLDW